VEQTIILQCHTNPMLLSTGDNLHLAVNIDTHNYHLFYLASERNV